MTLPPTTPHLDPGRSSRSPFPEGALAVAIGVGLNGISTYAFLAITQRAVGERPYAAFAVVWGLALILGPGLFHPLEQELSRATAYRASRGDGSAPVLRRSATAGLLAWAGVAVMLVIGWFLGLEALLDSNVVLAAALMVSLGGYAGASLVRGVLSGRRKFVIYGGTMAMEGLSRLFLSLAFLGLGIRSVAVFAFSLGAAFTLAAGLGMKERPLADPGPRSEWTELTPALGTLLAISLAEAFLLNIGPLVVKVLSEDQADAGRFLNAMIVARLPLFLFVAIRVTLLPNLARLAGRADWRAFRRLLQNLVLALAGVVAAVVAAAAFVGPSLVHLMFGTRVAALDMSLLAAASGGSMIVLSLSLALVAIGRPGWAAAGWTTGVVAFMAALPFGSDPFLRVETAALAAMVASTGFLAASFHRSVPDRQTR